MTARRKSEVKQAYLAGDLAVGKDLGANTHSEDVRAILSGNPVQLHQALLLQQTQLVALQHVNK